MFHNGAKPLVIYIFGQFCMIKPVYPICVFLCLFFLNHYHRVYNNCYMYYNMSLIHQSKVNNFHQSALKYFLWKRRRWRDKFNKMLRFYSESQSMNHIHTRRSICLIFLMSSTGSSVDREMVKLSVLQRHMLYMYTQSLL